MEEKSHHCRVGERSAKISTLMRQSKAPENKQALTERRRAEEIITGR